MCDEEINQGLVQDPSLSRRAFGLMSAAAAAAAASAAYAADNVIERDVDIKTPDGVTDAAVFYPKGRGTWPAVLMWPDIMSLRPVFRDMGRRLAAEGYVVLVPNYYYRVKRAPVVGPTFNFNDPPQRQQLMAMRTGLGDEATDRDAKVYLAWLDAQPQVNKRRKAGVQGYCMGGPYAFRTAAVAPDRIGAVATFHGGGLVADGPSSPHLTIAKSKADYLLCIAANDDERQPEAKGVLKKTLDDNKRWNKVEVYTGCAHGWTVAGSSVYDAEGAERAWANLLSFYQRELA